MGFSRLLLFGLIGLLLPLAAAAGEGAPFGLRWGMSVGALRDEGVQLRELQADESGRRYSTANLPRMLGDLEEVTLSFGVNDRLHRIEAVSRDFRNDLDGSSLKARYGTLSRALAAKYGPGKATHDVNKPYDSPPDFLLGIHLGASRWYTDFDSKEVSVRLAIRATRRDVGNYVLIYRNKALEKRSRELPGESDAL